MIMSNISTFRDLIAALGGAAQAATVTGLPRRSVQAMVERDSIAADHWPAFVNAATANGLGVSLADLAAWRLARRSARRPDMPTLAPETADENDNPAAKNLSDEVAA